MVDDYRFATKNTPVNFIIISFEYNIVRIRTANMQKVWRKNIQNAKNDHQKRRSSGDFNTNIIFLTLQISINWNFSFRSISPFLQLHSTGLIRIIQIKK